MCLSPPVVALGAGLLLRLTRTLSVGDVTEHCWWPHAIFSPFFFAAMDGVPFMISEKFSCVPESVSPVPSCPFFCHPLKPLCLGVSLGLFWACPHPCPRFTQGAS